MALTDNLVAYWKLDESSGDAADATGNGYTLTNTSTTYSAAKINNGADFDGTNSKLSRTISNNLSGSFTISAWVKIDVTGADHLIAVSEVSSYSNYWLFFGINGSQKLYANLYDGTNNPYIVTTTTFSTGTWYHVVFIRDTAADNIRIYINGSSAASAVTDTTTSVPTYGDFNLGKRTYFASKLDGSLDEVGIWSRALSAGEISQLYNSGNGLQYPFSSGTPNHSNLLLLGVGN